MKIKLIRNLEREGTDYIEFLIGTRDTKVENWSEDSLFLNSSVFSTDFVSCFVGKDGLFDIVGPEIFYDTDEVNNIQLLLKKRESVLNSVDYLEEFVKEISQRGESFLGELEAFYDREWQADWKEIRDKLLEVNRSLIKLTEEALEKKKGLWVIGV